MKTDKVLIGKSDPLVPEHDLHRFPIPATIEIGPQHGMTGCQLIPALCKPFDIERPSQGKSRLLKICTCIRIHSAVEPHPLLHRRKLVNVLDLPEMTRLFRKLLQFLHAQSLKLHIAWCQFSPILRHAMSNQLL
ncbi:hypothetical protein D3C74_210510 [compost metagenome]